MTTPSVVHVTDDDAASIREIADEYGVPPLFVVLVLELDRGRTDLDEILRPRVATLYRIALESLGAVHV